MDTFDLDLDSLDLKTIDLGPPKAPSKNSGSTMFDLSGGLGNGNYSGAKSPELTISTSNNDMMPPDALGDDLGLSMIANKDKLRPDDSSLTTNFNGGSSRFNTSYSDATSNADDILRDIGIDIGENDILGNSSFDNITNIDLDKNLFQLKISKSILKTKMKFGGGGANFILVLEIDYLLSVYVVACWIRCQNHCRWVGFILLPGWVMCG